MALKAVQAFFVALALVFTGGIVTAETLAPGWGTLGYEIPVPGTYELPVIYPAVGGKVLTTSGGTADLGDFLGDKVVVLSFIYTSCDDINGCPLSIFVMHQLQNQLGKRPEIADKLRLVSYSFDIEKDTPEVLRTYQQQHGGSHHGAGQASAEWLFVVAASQQSLQPVLKSYGQFMLKEVNEEGENTGKLSHLLRVFLIDAQGRVRNIYSPDFLHPDILLADIETILIPDTKD